MKKYIRLLWFLAPWLLLIAHGLIFGGWIIDDAGISFAYARNLAQGHGLVSQPGMAPVEGFSNFLWVALLAPFFVLRIFDPVVTPKALGLVLALGTFYLLYRAWTKNFKRPPAEACVALALLAASTPFALWTVGGLENPLLALIIAAMVYLASGEDRPRSAAALGALAAAAAMTRPDAVLFSLAYPALWAIRRLTDKEKPAAKRMALYAAAFAGVFGAFLLFRYACFGDLLPNTYYAKGQGVGGRTDWYRVNEFAEGVAGSRGVTVFAALAAAALYLAARRRLGRPHQTLLVFLAISTAVYFLMPRDLMPQFRFATPFLTVFYLFAVLAAAEFISALKHPRLIFATAALLLLAMQAWAFLPQSRRLARTPFWPMSFVAREYAARYDSWADEFGIEDGSVLLRDVGGTLYYSRLRVYDFAGLCDRTIAKTFFHRVDIARFHDYIFEEIRPTFVDLPRDFAERSRFEEDPRFRRDYMPIEKEEFVGALDDGVRVFSGRYVRRDAVRPGAFVP
jgi:hypothetical protein